jgi:CRP-like cAMP-binding protein
MLASKPRSENTIADRTGALHAMDLLATRARLRRGETIYAHEDPVAQWYCIVSGIARKSTLLSDGRRRIVDFLLPGDFFGFSAREQRFFDVEAIVDDTVVASYSLSRMELLADVEREVARLIRQMAFESISRLQARVLILGRVNARKKVCAFLVEMAERSHRDPTEVVDLPMSRYDIADYLALSVETVSRALTELQFRHAIELTGRRRVTILDRDQLEDDGTEARPMYM